MLTDYRVRQREYLLEISRALTARLDLESVLRRILDAACELLASNVGLIVLRRDDGSFAPRAMHGILPPTAAVLRAAVGRCARARSRRATGIVPQLDRKVALITRSGDFGLRQTVAIPMIVGDDLVGMIYIFRGYSDVFSANDRQVLQSFADQAAIAVHNAQLYQQVSREKQRLDAIIEASADGVLILDTAQRITVFNRALARMSGFAADDVIGLPHDEVIVIDAKRAGLTLERSRSGRLAAASTIAVSSSKAICAAKMERTRRSASRMPRCSIRTIGW